MPTALAERIDALARGDEHEQRIAEAAREVLGPELKRGGIAERDRLLVELAREHFGNMDGARAKARAIGQAGRRYAASGWMRDRLAARCPRPAGTVEAALWRVFKAWPELPGLTRLRELLGDTDG